MGEKAGLREARGRRRPSDFDLCPEGLLDVLCVRVSPRPDGEAAVLPQGRGHRGGVHVLRQLALVSEGVHDRAVSRQLGQRDASGQAESQPLLPRLSLAAPPPPGALLSGAEEARPAAGQNGAMVEGRGRTGAEGHGGGPCLPKGSETEAARCRTWGF